MDFFDILLKMNKQMLEIFLEFFLIGIVMGIAEDLIALHFATGEPFTWKILGIVALVALPFAVFSELIIDRKPLIKINYKKKK